MRLLQQNKSHKWLDKEATSKRKVKVTEGFVKIVDRSSWFYKTCKNVNKREQTGIYLSSTPHFSDKE